MEHMASEVIKCIGNAVYNKEPIRGFQGIGGNHRFVFNDESSLKAFSLLSGERKKGDETTYEPVRNEVLEYLENVWHVDKNFKGCYSEDYSTLTSLTTACIDKYSVSIFRKNEDWTVGKPLESFDRQPPLTTSDGKRLVSCIISVMRQGVTSLGNLGMNALVCFYQTEYWKPSLECYLLLWKMS